MNKNNHEKGMSKFFLVIFVLVFIVGIVLAGVVHSDMEGKVEVDAKVIEYSRIHNHKTDSYSTRVVVSYAYNGEEYTSQLSNANSTMKEGKTIKIYVNPNYPQDAVSGSYVLTYIFCGIGAVGMLFMVLNLHSNNKKEKAKEKLLQEGKIIYGMIKDFSQDKTLKVNDRYPYVVFCSYTDEDSGTEYVFKSDRLWSNPEISLKIGDPVKIYVEWDNYQVNYVDIEDAIEQAERKRLSEWSATSNPSDFSNMNFR